MFTLSSQKGLYYVLASSIFIVSLLAGLYHFFISLNDGLDNTQAFLQMGGSFFTTAFSLAIMVIIILSLSSLFIEIINRIKPNFSLFNLFEAKGTNKNGILETNVRCISYLEEAKSYAKGCFQNILTEKQLQKLENNINELWKGVNCKFTVIEEVEFENVYPYDLFHFAWNLLKRLTKENPKLTMYPLSKEFLKGCFPITLRNIEDSTIKSKLATKDGTYKLRLIPLEEPLIPYVFK